MAQSVLVTGGAGYIGSHACLRLSEAGYHPIVFDNLSNGHARSVRWGPLVEGDVRDLGALKAAFEAYRPVAVMHFAALIEVGQSMLSPAEFYDVNVGGAAAVVRAAAECGVRAFVFSSTCATYGDPAYTPIDEAHLQAPVNPYGNSKLLAERILKDVSARSGLKYAILRYFNAAGSDPDGRIGEEHDPETHAVPIILDVAAGRRTAFSIFGTDYPTRDGTAERDYIHVLDLADAHVLALVHLLDGGESEVWNLGTGRGTTVAELIKKAERVTQRTVTTQLADRRAGDPPILVANSKKAFRELGWRPIYGLEDMIGHAWAWQAKSGCDPEGAV